MAKQQVIHVRHDTYSVYELIDGWTLSGLAERLHELEKNVISFYKNEGYTVRSVYFDSEYDYDDNTVIALWVSRDETEKEKSARLERERRQREKNKKVLLKKEERERKEYERLKKKFGEENIKT